MATPSMPRNIGFGIENIERERTNAQLVLQYAASDNIEITTDYTYSRLEDISHTDTFGLWFGGPGSVSYAHINENGTFDYVEEMGGDYSGTMHQGSSENENKSLGLNIKWQASDLLSFELDAHSSSATSQGTDNGATSSFFIMGGLNVAEKFYDATSTDIPLLGATWANLNPEGEPHLLPEHYASLFAGVVAGENETDVDQVQFNGEWLNDSDDSLASIDFGVSWMRMTTKAKGGYGQYSAGWYGNMGIWSDYMVYEDLGGDFLSDFSGGGDDMLIPYYYSYDQDAAMANAEALYDQSYVPAPWRDDHTIEEETTSAYIQLNFESEFNEMPLNTVVGLRYESTDVDASSLQREPLELIWKTGEEWETEFTEKPSL